MPSYVHGPPDQLPLLYGIKNSLQQNKLLSISSARLNYIRLLKPLPFFCHAIESAGPNSFERESFSHRKRTKATMVEGINSVTTKIRKTEFRIVLATSQKSVPISNSLYLNSAQQYEARRLN